MEYIDYVIIFVASTASLFSGMAALYSKTRDEVTRKLKPWGKLLFIVILSGATLSGISGVRQLENDINKHEEVVLAIERTKSYIEELERLTKNFRTDANSQIATISQTFKDYKSLTDDHLSNLNTLGNKQIEAVTKVSANLKEGLSASEEGISGLNDDLQKFSAKESERFSKRTYTKINEFYIKKDEKHKMEEELYVYLDEVGNDTGDITIRIIQTLYEQKQLKKFDLCG